MKKRTLPLGIDIGTTHVRIAQLSESESVPRVESVAVREIGSGMASSGALADPEHVGHVLEDALNELRTKQRRCVVAIGEPDALMRAVRFPAMTSLERERSARFEAQKYADFPLDDALVRIHPSEDRETWILGIARSAAVTTRCAALRAAGLKAVALDHEAFALLRAFPDHDAVLDIGHQRSSLHLRAAGAPLTFLRFCGGADITRAIERELRIDQRTAEKRKRILGTAGSGERARASLVAELVRLIEDARRTHPFERVALCGNGARLAGIHADLGASAAVRVNMPVAGALRGGAYPDDVVQSGALDWTLAAALAQWQR